jgi:hypothetical protein
VDGPISRAMFINAQPGSAAALLAHVRMAALVRALRAFADHAKNRIRKVRTQENRAEEYPIVRAK